MESDEIISDKLVSQKTSEHLWKIGNMLSSSCAAASRFYLCNLERHLLVAPKLLKIGSKRARQYCNHCGSLWSRGNYTRQIQPCPSANSHLKKLLKLEAEQPWRLNNRQKKKIKKLRESTNKIVYNCFVCKKKTVFPGNKTCNARYKSVPSSTPFSMIKIKKGDLNAGLFIPSPSCSKDGNKNTPDNKQGILKEASVETPIRNQNTSLSESKSFVDSGTPSNSSAKSFVKNSANLFKYQTTPSSRKSRTPGSATLNADKQSRSKKKNNSLLSQILKQEQSSKKKTSLSSFLVSL